jgi:two-component system, chemotaxis family, sensor kinase CheA
MTAMLLKDQSIFIVEDNSHNRIVFQMTLVLTGARLEFERWGRDAVQRLNNQRVVNLIILDLMLHNNVSGYDIFIEIRSIPKYDNIPIVAVSAAEPAIALPKTRQMGFSGFIAKPINDDLFPKQLARILAGEKIWYAGDRFEGLEEPVK